MFSTKEKIKEYAAAVILWLLMMWEDIRELLVTAAVTFLVCLGITTFVFQPVVVHGTSMYPTIRDGSMGFSSIITRRTKGIERFDIVVINVESSEKLLIKRVIGLPGETLEFINGVLYIDGKSYSEDFLNSNYVASQIPNSPEGVFTRDFSVTLGDDEYFCMGDNRLVSADSRVYGPFHGSDILSCGIFIIFPFSYFGVPGK
ncbi:MAG: signal peptidase I [Erysipelotrichaceae bacterium]|nr:signal peptidase I [Erysipelotrichaceae bacterium]